VTPEIQRLSGPGALYEAAADVFQRVSSEAVRDRGVCRVALAGGSTPKGLYALLADDARWTNAVRWDALDVFWGDERHVGPDHRDSNYRMADEAMLSKVPVPPARVHRVLAENPDAAAAANSYEAEIRTASGVATGVPRFDVILLGLGSDGHTASLFPGTLALSERNRLVVANWVEKMAAYRITMTLPVLNAARVVMFLVAGADKAEALRAVLQPKPDSPPLPAALVRPEGGRVLWLLDPAAARRLQEIPT
jgi:6-phosphogluconolactonase